MICDICGGMCYTERCHLCSAIYEYIITGKSDDLAEWEQRELRQYQQRFRRVEQTFLGVVQSTQYAPEQMLGDAQSDSQQRNRVPERRRLRLVNEGTPPSTTGE